MNRFWNFLLHNSVISNGGKYKINYLYTRYRSYGMNLNRATNNLQRILNYPDNYNNSVLACAERFYMNFKMAAI